MPGYYSAQLYSYPARRWRKKRRQYLLNNNYYANANAKESEQGTCENSNDASETSTNNVTNYIPNTSGPSVSQNGNGGLNINNCTTLPNAVNDTFEDSKDSWMRDYDDGSDLPDAGELDDPESDFDDYEEYSSRKKKSKRGGKEVMKKKRIDYSDAEKPYQCELCGARYKTRPGLSYHYSHSHQDSGNGSLSGNGISEEERDLMYNNNSNNGNSVKPPLPPGNNNNNISYPTPNHSSHPNPIILPQNSQPPVTPAQSNHLQNNSFKSLNPSDDKDKKGNDIIT